MTSLGNNEDRFKEVMRKTVSIWDFEKDYFFDKIILAHAILIEDAKSLVSVVEKAGGRAQIEEFSEIPDPDGIVYKCSLCGSLYDHNISECCDYEDCEIEKCTRKDAWLERFYYYGVTSALLHKNYRYRCCYCFNLSVTPGKCCNNDFEDALQVRFCELLKNNHNATAAYLLNKYPDLADGKGEGAPWKDIRDIELVKKLQENCKDINASILSFDGSIRYLRTAEFAKLIIEAGANKDALTHLLKTSVHYQDDIPFARVLINAGADAGSLDVERLGMCNDAEILKLFLDNGADPNLCDDYSGSVLNTRIRERDNDLESIELLLQRGADPNMLTEREEWDEDEENVIATYKETSLEYAVDISSSIDIIRLLIKYGANVNVKHYDGRSLVDMALDNGDVEIAELLKQHGAVANFSHTDQMTAAEIVEEYFPSSKMKFSSTAINFAPNFSMCTTPPHEDTIAIISKSDCYIIFSKAVIYVRYSKNPDVIVRFADRLFGGKVKEVDLPWKDILSVTCERTLGLTSISIEPQSGIYINDFEAAAVEQFANDLKNYARSQGAKL